jgi:hypothetical protein
MTEKVTPVDGPFRITVEPIPTGVTLDVEAFVQSAVHDVLAALVNNDRFADRFAELQDVQARDPHVIERAGDLRFESLVADLVAVAGTKLPVYGLQTLALAGQIAQLAAPAVAARQAGEGGAAA